MLQVLKSLVNYLLLFNFWFLSVSALVMTIGLLKNCGYIFLIKFNEESLIEVKIESEYASQTQSLKRCI